MSNTIRRVLFAVTLVALSGGLSWATAQQTPDRVLTGPATATASGTPTLTVYPLPADVEFHFQGQTPDREATFRKGIEAAYSYMRSIGLEADPGPIAIWAYKDAGILFRDLRARYGADNPQIKTIVRTIQDGHGGGHMYGGAIWWMGQPGFAQTAGNDWWLRVSGAGYIEALFFNLNGRMLNSHLGENPYWMIEGAPMYFSARIMEQSGQFPGFFLDSHNSNRWEMRRTTVPLEALETYYPNRTEGVAALGVEYLASRAGDSAFLDYNRGIARGLNWRDSFKTAFGMTVQQFYDDYRAYRLKNYPIFYNSVIGKVVNAKGDLVKDMWVWACPEAPTYDCYPLQTGYVGTGAFVIDVPQGKVLVALSTTHDRESIFGYFERVDGVLPTGIPGSNFGFDFPMQQGTVTTDRGKATLLDVSGKTTDSNGNLSIFIQLPPGLPK